MIENTRGEEVCVGTEMLGAHHKIMFSCEGLIGMYLIKNQTDVFVNTLRKVQQGYTGLESGRLGCCVMQRFISETGREGKGVSFRILANQSSDDLEDLPSTTLTDENVQALIEQLLESKV